MSTFFTGFNRCERKLSFDKISIEWDKEGYTEFEELFLKELQKMKGYILQAIWWLNQKPKDRRHAVHIDLTDDNIEYALNEKYDSELSYFVEIYFEKSGKLNLNLMERDYEDLNEILIGLIQIPPLDTWTKEEKDVLTAQIKEFLGIEEK